MTLKSDLILVRSSSNRIEQFFSVLIIKNSFDLIRCFLNTFSIKYNHVYTNIAIEFDSFDVVALLRNMHPESFIDCEKEYLPSVLISFRKSNMCWLAKINILKLLLSYISYGSTEEFLMFVLQVLEKENPADNPMYYAPNVLLLICNLIELCRFIGKKYDFLTSHTSKIEGIVTVVAADYINNIDDEFELRALVFEKDYENRDSLDLLSTYNISKVMDNKNIEKIALELWTSQYDVKGHIMTTSSAFKILMHDSSRKPKDVITDHLFSNWKFRSPEYFDHHLYQFQVWKKSMKARFITEFIFMMTLVLIFQYYFMRIISIVISVQNRFNSLSSSTNPAELPTLARLFEQDVIAFYNNMQNLIVLCY